jgi:lipoprotein signal peptidase
MPAALEFLKPTFIKSLFLVEWALFILISLASGELEPNRQLLVAVYPLLIFYLVACILAEISQRRRQIARGWALYLIAVGSMLLDQVVKSSVEATIHFDTSIPVVDGWLHISNLRNERGSWLISFFHLNFEITPLLVHVSLAIIVLLSLILFHRFYVTTRRRSLWADIAFLGLFSGYAGFLCDMNLRGYVLDYICLPHIVAADLKDIALTIGLAAFFAEIWDNPAISMRDAFRWEGWRKEWDSLARFIQEFGAFTIGELRTFLRSIRWRQPNSMDRDET